MEGVSDIIVEAVSDVIEEGVRNVIVETSDVIVETLVTAY